MHIHEQPEDHKRTFAEPPRDTDTALEEAPASVLSPAALLALQRKIGNVAVARMMAESPHTADVQRSAVHDVLRSPGQPLDESTRNEMGTRLGADFSDVRLHTGPAAQRSATEIGARAYTSGNHVVIGAGGGDEHTLAHELTHVVQQRSGPVAGTDNGSGLSVSDPGDRFEREAEAVATEALAKPLPASATGSPDQVGTGVQRSGTADALPVQRAGGHGGITPRAAKTILQKPTNETEEEFYRTMREAEAPDSIRDVMPQSYTAEEVAEIEARMGTVAPQGPDVVEEEAPQPDTAEEGPDAIQVVVPQSYTAEGIAERESRMSPPAEEGSAREGSAREGSASPEEPSHEVFIDDIRRGMTNGRLLDIKLGSATASRTELIGGGMAEAAAKWKKWKMTVSDRLTGSKRRGYRVVDAPGTKHHPRMLTGMLSTVHLKKYINDGGRDFAGDRDEIVAGMKAVRDAAERSAYTFIAASVLIGIDKNLDSGAPVRVVLIDFAHPIHKGTDEHPNPLYTKYRERFLNGLDNLIEAFEALEPPTEEAA